MGFIDTAKEIHPEHADRSIRIITGRGASVRTVTVTKLTQGSYDLLQRSIQHGFPVYFVTSEDERVTDLFVTRRGRVVATHKRGERLAIELGGLDGIYSLPGDHPRYAELVATLASLAASGVTAFLALARDGTVFDLGAFE
jgi:hypothetical protein